MKTHEIDWSMSDAEIACEMGWSLFRTATKRFQNAPEKYQINDWIGKKVRLTGAKFVELLTVNPNAWWWEGVCQSEGGDFLVLAIPGRGTSTYMKDGWTLA